MAQRNDRAFIPLFFVYDFARPANNTNIKIAIPKIPITLFVMDNLKV
jgi:hypothetical protein